MADAFNNPTSHADMIPEIWDTQAILAADDHTNNALMALSADASSMLVGGGDIINFPKQADVDLVTVSQTAETEAAQFSASTIQLTIDTHKGNPILVTSQADSLSNQDIMENLFQQAGFAVGRTVDQSLAALHASAGITVTGNTSLDITEAQVREAKRGLDDANAPRGGRFLVVDVQQMDALSAISRFTEADKIANPAGIVEGQVGRIHGFNVFMDQNIVEVASNVGLAHNLFGVFDTDPRKSALVHAFATFRPSRAAVSQRIIPQIGLRATFTFDGKRFGDIMTVEVNFGVKSVRSEWLGDLQTQDS